jgi:hypothetical protein
MHIYTRSISKITRGDVEEFCKSKVNENAYLDYKRDFPSDLTKAESGHKLYGLLGYRGPLKFSCALKLHTRTASQSIRYMSILGRY